MRAIFLGFGLLCSTTAFAKDGCKDGVIDVFKFVSWNAKINPKKNVEIYLTFHNSQEQIFSQASFGMAMIDGNGKEIGHVSVETQNDVLANADHVETYVMNAEPDLAYKVNASTPIICVYSLVDKKTGKLTNYLKPDPANPPSGPAFTKPKDVKSPVPYPADAVEITDSPPAHLLRYSTPQKLAQMIEFYRDKFKGMGWKEKSFKANDARMSAEYDSPKSEWVSIDMEATETGTRVTANGPYVRK